MQSTATTSESIIYGKPACILSGLCQDAMPRRDTRDTRDTRNKLTPSSEPLSSYDPRAQRVSNPIPGILVCDPIPKILELASQVFLSDSLWAVSKIMVVKNFIKKNNPRDVQGLTVTLLFGCCAWSMPSSGTEDCSVQVLF